jgi:hypothetical protein
MALVQAQAKDLFNPGYTGSPTREECCAVFSATLTGLLSLHDRLGS